MATITPEELNCGEWALESLPKDQYDPSSPDLSSVDIAEGLICLLSWEAETLERQYVIFVGTYVPRCVFMPYSITPPRGF